MRPLSSTFSPLKLLLIAESSFVLEDLASWEEPALMTEELDWGEDTATDDGDLEKNASWSSSSLIRLSRRCVYDRVGFLEAQWLGPGWMALVTINARCSC